LAFLLVSLGVVIVLATSGTSRYPREAWVAAGLALEALGFI